MDSSTTPAGPAAARRPSRRERRSALDLVPPPLRRPLAYLAPMPEDSAANRIVQRLGAFGATKPLPDVEHEALTVGAGGHQAGVHLYRDADPGTGALLWLHGGGRVNGQVAQDHALCSEIARATGALVVSVDYTLAGRAPYPAALDDAWAALLWLHEHAEEHGVDGLRIAVGGQGGGAGLAAELAQRATDGLVPVCFQLLDQPMLDDRTASAPEGRGNLVWTPGTNRAAWAAHLGDAPEAALQPWAVAARREDLRNLPAAWISVGELDLFHEEAADYAERLTISQVYCALHVESGMYHQADRIAAQAPSMQAYRHRMIEALEQRIGRETLVD